MSRRARALGFGALALLCAGLAAAVAGGYRGEVEAQLGELRPVVVARAELEARRPLGAADAGRLLEERRVPARFAPVDGLSDPAEAVGRAPVTPIPAGAYVTAAMLRLPRDHSQSSRGPGDQVGEAVEVTVTGAGALGAGVADPIGSRVDVIVTTEPHTGGGPGRTYVAVRGTELIALREGGPGGAEDGLGAGGIGPAGPAPLVATLACRRSQCLRLIQAHNYAREIRLIASRG